MKSETEQRLFVEFSTDKIRDRSWLVDDQSQMVCC